MLSESRSARPGLHFRVGIVGLLLNPFYFARGGLRRNIAALSRHVTGKVLDVGCGRKPYQELFATSDVVGLEVDTPGNRAAKRADRFYDGKRFPFPDGTFDSVVATQVLEHVFTPDEFLDEIGRVLKAGGHLLMTVPFVWDEHEQPNDFARYSSFGLTYLLEGSGFEVVEYRKSVNDARLIFQLLNAHLYKMTMTRNRHVNLLARLVFFAPLNILGETFGRLLPKNDDLYLDSVVLARKRKVEPRP